MSKDYKKYLTASKLKNWLACNYTIINDINKNQIKKKLVLRLKKLEKKEEMNLKKKFFKN